MRRPLIAGNWKMNADRAQAAALAEALAGRYAAARPDCDVLVCPPYPYLDIVGRALAGRGPALGAQDCHGAKAGAHTGDVSAAMLADIGCSHVIVGHSERRADHGEGDAAVRAKAEAALAAGLTPILCLGETEAERDRGGTLAVCERQLRGSLPAGASPANLVVAYEPVWAIGTGRTPNVAEIIEVHRALRRLLAESIAEGDRVRLLYGGSVKPGNAAELLAPDDVDGALVGGASLDADGFWAIAEAAAA